MSEEEAENVVWGIKVPQTGNRKHWPDEIKAMAAERVRAGAPIVEICRELGANESVVHRWLSKQRSEAAKPSFVEVTAPLIACQAAPGPLPSSACTLRLGDVTIDLLTCPLLVPHS